MNRFLSIVLVATLVTQSFPTDAAPLAGCLRAPGHSLESTVTRFQDQALTERSLWPTFGHVPSILRPMYLAAAILWEGAKANTLKRSGAGASLGWVGITLAVVSVLGWFHPTPTRWTFGYGLWHLPLALLTFPSTLSFQRLKAWPEAVRKSLRWFFNHPVLGHPATGVGLVLLLVVTPAVCITAFLGWPAVAWAPEDLRDETIRLLGRLAFLEGLVLTSAAVRSMYVDSPRDKESIRLMEREISPTMIWIFTLISTMGSVYWYYASNQVRDTMDQALTKAMAAISASTAFLTPIYLFHHRVSEQWDRRLGTAFIAFLTVPALAVTIIHGLQWSVFFGGFDSRLDLTMAILSLFVLSMAYVIPIVLPQMDGAGPPLALLYYPVRQKVSQTLVTITGAIPFVFVLALIHSWGHWLDYHLTLYPPGGSIAFTSFVYEHFVPPTQTASLSYFGKWLGFTRDGADVGYAAAGIIATWVYGATLWFMSLFMKRLPGLKRILELSGLTVFVLNLLYLVAYYFGVVEDPNMTDWAFLWKNASPAFTHGMIGLSVLLPLAALLYRSLAEPRDWPIARNYAGKIESEMQRGIRGPLNRPGIWAWMGFASLVVGCVFVQIDQDNPTGNLGKAGFLLVMVTFPALMKDAWRHYKNREYLESLSSQPEIPKVPKVLFPLARYPAARGHGIMARVISVEGQEETTGKMVLVKPWEPYGEPVIYIDAASADSKRLINQGLFQLSLWEAKRVEVGLTRPRWRARLLARRAERERFMQVIDKRSQALGPRATVPGVESTERKPLVTVMELNETIMARNAYERSQPLSPGAEALFRSDIESMETAVLFQLQALAELRSARYDIRGSDLNFFMGQAYRSYVNRGIISINDSDILVAYEIQYKKLADEWTVLKINLTQQADVIRQEIERRRPRWWHLSLSSPPQSPLRPPPAMFLSA